jgi:hypothetical protein
VRLDALAPAVTDDLIVGDDAVVCLELEARLHADDRGFSVASGKEHEIAGLYDIAVRRIVGRPVVGGIWQGSDPYSFTNHCIGIIINGG